MPDQDQELPKYERIAATLRSRIVEGQWPPGTRLPTRVELETQFDASSPTLQKALDQLIVQGFVRTRGRAGSFVTEHPPHQHCIAVGYPGSPAHTPLWSRMWQAIDLATRHIETRGPWSFKRYYDLALPGSHSLDSLGQDLHDRCLLGVLLLPGTPESIQLISRQLQPFQPVASAAVFSQRHYPGLNNCRTQGFLARALDWMMQAGRQRIAVIGSSWATEVNAQWDSLFRQRSLAYDLRRIALVPPNQPDAARRAAAQVLAGSLNQRADGLIITDDHLVETATAGILDVGLRPPADLDVIALANFPYPPRSLTPVTRLGYDFESVIAGIIDVLTARATDQVIDILPVLESEINSSAAVRSYRDELAPPFIS